MKYTDLSINDKDLYYSVVEHRRTFIGLKGFDYNTLAPHSIDLHLPDDSYGAWKRDYETMQESMIYGESLPFDKLLEKIYSLNERINKLTF